MANLSDLKIRIAADGSQAVRELDRVNTALGRHGQEAAASTRHAQALRGAFDGLAGATAALFAGFASAQGLVSLVQGMIQAYTEVDRLTKGFAVVSGSSQAAAAEMAYVGEVANKLGLEVSSSAEAYLSLTAAAKGTTLQGEQARGIFEAVSLAMAKLGKSASDTQGALLAVEQMISKGKVSAEELRGQLGERLPGAFQAAANAMGVTTAELDKLLSTGEITAEEMLPKLTQELNRLYDDGKEVSGVTAEWNRFKNELSSAGATIAETTGLINVLIAALANAASNAKALASWLNGEGWNNFATQVDRHNHLMTEKIRLEGEFHKKAKEVAELESRNPLAEKLFPQLAPAQAELRALGNELGGVMSKLASTAEANKQLAAAQTQSIDAAAKQTAATQAQAAAQAELDREFDRAERQQAALDEAYKKKKQAQIDDERALSRGSKAQKAATKEVENYADEVRRLIDQYLPAEAAALKWAETQTLLNAAIAAGSITQEKATQILEAMKKEMGDVGKAAEQEADGFAKAWADGVNQIDDTFQGLWRSLITGQGDVLGDLKATVLEWVADLSYQLLLSPLILPIQTALLGGTGAAVAGSASGMVSGAGTLGSVGNLFSTLSSGIGWFGNALTSVASGAIFSGISTGFSLAAANIGAAGYFGAMGTTLATAGSSFASGAIGTGIGMAAPYLLPAIAAIAAIAALSGAFTGDGYDHEPGYWGVSTGGSGVDNRFRGGRGVSGGFGLSFGVDAASTDEFDWDMWPEYEKMMAAMADMSQQLANFYGEDVAKAVEKALSDASGEGLLLLTHEFSSSFVYAFDRIIAEAAKTGDDLAVVMEDVFSGIVDYTSMDTYATSIQEAMVIAQTALAMADDLAGTAMGDALDLTGEVVADAKRLAGYGLLVREEGEGAAEAFVRMATQLAVLDQAVQQTATDLSGLTAEGVLELSTALVDAFGSLDAAAQAQAFYYDQFTTQTEKLVDAIQAAAKAINREVPKLQDELMKLSKDIVEEVEKIAEDLSTGMEEMSGALEDTGNFWLDIQRRQADQWAKGIAANAAAIADGSASAATQAVTNWQLWKMVEEGLSSYGDTLRELGYDVDHGAQAFVDSLQRIRDSIKDPLDPSKGGTTTETITIPGDPNAAILARLLDDLPKTRQGFDDLIRSIDLTTEAGRKLYAGLLELAPQFDLLYDGVEAFTDWLLGVDAVGRATADLTAVFAEWGLSLPGTRDALLTLYESGDLTTEQMAILGAYVRELGLVFGDLGQAIDDTTSKILDYTELYIRLAEAQGDASLALTLRRQQELKNAADDTTRAILRQIYALEDETAAREAARQKTEEITNLQIRLATAMGDDATALRLRRELELANASDAFTRVLLRQIYAYEDATAAAEAAERQRRETWQAAETARRAAYDEEVKALNAYNDAARQAAEEANAAATEALQQLQEAAEEAYAVANNVAQAWIEALSAVGLEAEATALARRLEAAAMDPALRSVYALVWQIEDAANLNAARADLATQALGYLGRDDEARAAQRALALAGTAPELRALQEWVYQLEDARLAADEAATGIQELIDGLRAVSDAIDNTIQSITELINATPEATRQTRRAAQNELAATLAAARAGTMPTSAGLERTLATLSENPAALFGDRISYLRDLGRTRGQLVALQSLVDAQVPIEEQNLEALKNLPVAMYPNFEAIVASIGQSGADTAGLLQNATAAVDAAIATMQTRDEALKQSITEIVPSIKEIPPYIEDNYESIVQKIGELQLSTIEYLVKLDTTMDGKLSYAELDRALGPLATNEYLAGLFQLLDDNQDGLLDAVEALPIALAAELYPAFDSLDLNLDGLLTFDELVIGLEGLANAEQIRELIALVDRNGDGILDELEVFRFEILQTFSQGFAGLDANLDNLIDYDELSILLGPIATNDEIKRVIAILDLNADGMLNALEGLPLGIAIALADNFTMLDTSLDGLLDFDELKAALGSIATDEQLRNLITLTDTNGDGFISQQEAANFKLNNIDTGVNDDNSGLQFPLNKIRDNTSVNGVSMAQILLDIKYTLFGDFAAGLSGYLSTIAANTAANNISIAQILLDIKYTLFGDFADRLSDYLASIVTNTADISGSSGNGITSTQGNTLIGHVDTVESVLNNIYTRLATTNSYLSTIDGDTSSISTNSGYLKSGSSGIAQIALDTKNTLFNGGSGYLGLGQYLKAINNNLYYGFTAVKNASISGMTQFATGGIASGPSSGYPVTLHGREAVIPLGDGNSVTAILSEPSTSPAPVVNYLREETAETAELRAALAELQGEIAALRAENRSIGAATVGELKDHNRRERKREVTGQKVEVIS